MDDVIRNFWEVVYWQDGDNYKTAFHTEDPDEARDQFTNLKIGFDYVVLVEYTGKIIA